MPSVVATSVSMDLSQFVARVYLLPGSFTTFFSVANEGNRDEQERGPFDAAAVMRSQDPFEDALWGATLGFDNYKDYFGF